jgi:hypothetical protein
MQRSVKLLRELVWYVVGAYVVRGNSKPALPLSLMAQPALLVVKLHQVLLNFINKQSAGNK